MGAPPAAAPASSQPLPALALVPDVLLVQQKHLNVANEMRKMFGAEPTEERNKRGNRQAQLRIQKKTIIVPSVEYTADFKKFGLSMSMTRNADGCAHFTFDHSKEYRHMHQRLLHLASVDRREGWPQAAIEQAQRHMHVEAMLESVDMFFQIEEYTAANILVERAIAYMQFVAHPSFQLADPRTRLLYAYMENRTFHVAVLKYIHLLTNRACHRTALELAKMLLNLDPSDPLAVLLVIDTLALRAREHQWLIDAVDHWAKERDAGFLFSIQYSYAMAHFHVATKNKEETSKADELLQAAMLRFPAVVLRLLECASVPPGARLQACALFTCIAETKITKNLKELILLYAKLTWSKWREPAVFEWLQRNASELAEKYDQEPATQERAKALANEQLNLFRSWPDEVIRHLCVIKPMANLLVDGAVPQVRSLVSADPSPPPRVPGVNRYGYTFGPPAASAAHSDLRLLFAALLPTYADFAPHQPDTTSMIGLALIATGTGCVKPCVAAFGGEQFRMPEEERQLQRFFSTFYCTVNLGGFMGSVLTPALRRGVMCFGDDTCYALGFGFPTLLVLLSIFIFAAGRSWYRIKQPRENVTLKFVSCAWYAAKMRLREGGTPPAHWLDYSINKYGSKLVSDMKIVFSILYLYLPVPIFWSLFDQQGSRWTFQASRLRSELFGVTLLPDQLQVLNPALVLLLIPVCPGGACPLLPDLPPLTKMFVGGMLASMAFFAAGILQVGIERSTLQAPGRHQSGLVVLSTLGCPVELTVRGAASVLLPARGSTLLAPLPHAELALHAACAHSCDGRRMRRHQLTTSIKPVAGLFMPVVIGQDSDDHISFHFMDPNAFSKSLSGKPKLKVVYVGETGPNKNVTISIETDNQLTDIYYVAESPINLIGESAYMHLAPGRYTWRAEYAGGQLGSGAGTLHAGGVYVLSARARRGRLDSVQLHAPNPPNELHLAWLLPQYLLISCAEIFFAVSGLEFSFTQAPKSMKTITIAAWYMSVAVGNFIVILVAQTKIFESRSTEFFVYATILAIAMLCFLKMAQDYQPRSIDDDDYSEESIPLLLGLSKVISVRSAVTTTTFTGATSAASCLGRMERARPGAWPPHARVHLATPTDSDAPATTLAKN
ncbi:solute carrier family 15 member 2-like [Cydia amplana]|uniref:solute carrier family 15 member 2-like n=1 Tax=Cydia amplana TaxID=1869771 RepID=UPI002FE55150